MDKLIHQDGVATVTNDGATVMKKLNIVHPAAKLMADISKSQDDEVRFIIATAYYSYSDGTILLFLCSYT